MTVHNKDAELKGNIVMVQMKGNLAVADRRNSERGPGRSGWLLQTWSGFPWPLQPWGIHLTHLRKLKEVILNCSLQPEYIKKPNLVEDKSLLGQSNHIAREKGTGKMSAPSEEKGGQSLRTQVKLTMGGTNCTPLW